MKSTRFFNIPYQEDGDLFKEDDIQNAWTITDNQLYAAVRSFGSALLNEGTYNLVQNTTDTYQLLLSSSGGAEALSAILNGYLAYSVSTVTWSGIVKGSFWYLYIQYSPDQPLIPESFTPVVTLTEKSVTNTNFLLMATVDATVDPPVLDTQPENKLTIDGLLIHLTNSVNPHGTTLTQTNINLLGGLTLGATAYFADGYVTGGVALGEVGITGLNTVSQSLVGAINEVNNKLGGTIVHVTGQFNSITGVEFTVTGASLIKNVMITPFRSLLEPISGFEDVGTMIHGLYGEDLEVSTPSSFRIYNTGINATQKFRAMVIYDD